MAVAYVVILVIASIVVGVVVGWLIVQWIIDFLKQRVAKRCHVSVERLSDLCDAKLSGRKVSIGICTVFWHCKSEKDLERYEALRKRMEEDYELLFCCGGSRVFYSC
jgi:hypothetical protein